MLNWISVTHAKVCEGAVLCDMLDFPLSRLYLSICDLFLSRLDL